MASPLTRAGFPNNRNLTKPFKEPKPNLPMREQKEKFKQQFPNEHFPMHEGNGCTGFKSTFGIRVYVPGPKKGRRTERKKKNRCRLISRDTLLDIPKMSLRALQDLRGQLKTLQIIEEWSGQPVLTTEMRRLLPLISEKVVQHMPSNHRIQLYHQDEQRLKSTLGRLKKQGVQSIQIKSILARLDQAAKRFFKENPPPRTEGWAKPENFTPVTMPREGM